MLPLGSCAGAEKKKWLPRMRAFLCRRFLPKKSQERSEYNQTRQFQPAVLPGLGGKAEILDLITEKILSRMYRVCSCRNSPSRLEHRMTF